MGIDESLPFKLLKIAEEKLKNYPNENFFPLVSNFKNTKETAFFPGGRGFYYERKADFNSSIKEIKILILGNDFGKEKDFEQHLDGNKKDIETNTWINLIKLLDSVSSQFPYHNCFFSNAYLGLRLNSYQKSGNSPFFKDKTYHDLSIKIFLEHLKIIQPKVIICLGNNPGKFLNDVFNKKKMEWFEVYDTSEMDDFPIIKIMKIYHPCMNPNHIKNLENKKKIKNILSDI